MAKYSGYIGFAVPVDKGNDIWEDVIVEHKYRGNILNQTRRYVEGMNVLDDIECTVRISILSDEFLRANLAQMRYLHYSGGVWKIKSVEPSYPRIVLNVGGVYNGPQASTECEI